MRSSNPESTIAHEYNKLSIIVVACQKVTLMMFSFARASNFGRDHSSLVGVVSTGCTTLKQRFSERRDSELYMVKFSSQSDNFLFFVYRHVLKSRGPDSSIHLIKSEPVQRSLIRVRI